MPGARRCGLRLRHLFEAVLDHALRWPRHAGRAHREPAGQPADAHRLAEGHPRPVSGRDQHRRRCEQPGDGGGADRRNQLPRAAARRSVPGGRRDGIGVRRGLHHPARNERARRQHQCDGRLPGGQRSAGGARRRADPDHQQQFGLPAHRCIDHSGRGDRAAGAEQRRHPERAGHPPDDGRHQRRTECPQQGWRGRLRHRRHRAGFGRAADRGEEHLHTARRRRPRAGHRSGRRHQQPSRHRHAGKRTRQRAGAAEGPFESADRPQHPGGNDQHHGRARFRVQFAVGLLSHRRRRTRPVGRYANAQRRQWRHRQQLRGQQPVRRRG